MPALALIFHAVENAAGSSGHESGLAVCEQCANRAVKFCGYLESHARRVYGSVTSKKLAAEKLAAKIKDGDVSDGFTARDIARKEWALLSTTDEVEAACEILIARKWLQKYLQSSGAQGGRSTVRYFINPKVRAV